MRETMFKVLMRAGEYVDTNRLVKGVYASNKPTLYDKETTIEGLEQQGRMVKDMAGEQFISETYFENLKLCELVDVSLII